MKHEKMPWKLFFDCKVTVNGELIKVHCCKENFAITKIGQTDTETIIVCLIRAPVIWWVEKKAVFKPATELSDKLSLLIHFNETAGWVQWGSRKQRSLLKEHKGRPAFTSLLSRTRREFFKFSSFYFIYLDDPLRINTNHTLEAIAGSVVNSAT